MASPPIFHLAPASQLRRGLRGGRYAPPGLAEEGFVHCAPREAVLAVARDCFAGLREPLWVLEIDPARLRAELRVEAPATPSGAGRAHLDRAAAFPHVYGPVDRTAIVAAGRLRRLGDGFVWPARLGRGARALAALRQCAAPEAA